VTRTTYCMKHEELEFVDEAYDVKAFLVEARIDKGIGSMKTGRSATEVRAVTDKGCKVHFIGGPKWNR